MSYNKNLYVLFCSPNINWVINSMVIRYFENMACVWKKGNSQNFLGGKPVGNRSLGSLRLGYHNYTAMGIFYKRSVGGHGLGPCGSG